MKNIARAGMFRPSHGGDRIAPNCHAAVTLSALSEKRDCDEHCDATAPMNLRAPS